MTAISVPYTFSNATASDATQVNANFDAIVQGLVDGTKDLTIAGLTLAGNLAANGNVALGNSIADDVTISGAVTADIQAKTSAANLGSTTKGFGGLYLASNNHYFGIIKPATLAADVLLTLPDAAPVAGQALVYDGSNLTTWRYLATAVSSVSADTVMTASDGVASLEVTTAATDKTITLPAAASSTGRTITIRKADTGVGAVVIDPNGAETIDGDTSVTISSRYDYLQIYCNGTSWEIVSMRDTYSHVTNITNLAASPPSYTFRLTRFTPKIVHMQIAAGASVTTKNNTTNPVTATALPTRYRTGVGVSYAIQMVTDANVEKVGYMSMASSGLISWQLDPTGASLWTNAALACIRSPASHTWIIGA